MNISTTKNIIRIGHSPDPDDAFMFYGFASGKVNISGCQIEHVLEDIQSLNQRATGNDALEVTAMSAHAFFELDYRYAALPVGTSVGRRYGPCVVSRNPMTLEELRGKRIALPGPKTTATLVARALLPAFEELHAPFTSIMDLVMSGEVDAGVLIHEGQLTYANVGLNLIVDLGDLFSQRFDGLPLPLGVNCVRRDLGEKLCASIEHAYRASVEIALSETRSAVEYAMGFSRGLSEGLTETFVRMYVNEDSLHFSDDMLAAMAKLRELYVETQSFAILNDQSSSR